MLNDQLNIDDVYVTSFSSTLLKEAQQQVSFLRNTVGSGGRPSANKIMYDGIKKADAPRESTTRFSPITYSKARYERIEAVIQDFNDYQLVDEKDLERVICDPKSAQMMEMVQAMNRKQDDVIYRSIVDDYTLVNADGTTSTVAIPSSQIIEADSKSLTLEKIDEGIQILQENYAMTAGSHVSLIANAKAYRGLVTANPEVRNAEYAGTPGIKLTAMGASMGTGGVNEIVQYEPLDIISDEAYCLLVVRDGVMFDVPRSVKTTIVKETGLNDHPYQLGITAGMSGSRVKNTHVVIIKCLNTI
jgi:hypothetical protein